MSAAFTFNESPQRTSVIKASNLHRFTNTVGIETHEIDAYRQGVEITREQHRLAGITKIGSGENDGIVLQASIGNGDDLEAGAFEDSHRDDVDGPWSTDGAIEPLTVRRAASFATVGTTDGHAIRADLMGGGHDSGGRRDMIDSVLCVGPAEPASPYVDRVGSIASIPLDRNERIEIDHAAPLDDAQTKSGVRTPPTADQSLIDAIEAMSPATDEGIERMTVRMTAGFVSGFSNVIGTDSLAFGGLGH